MPLSTSSVLVRTIEASRLLTAEQLQCAVVSACDAGDESRVVVREVSDDAIGRRLVELGYLNAWQVEQLKAGRSQFYLGPYRVLDSIGRGGMGHVFKAEHELLGRVEAIKVLPRNKTNAETIIKFRHEIRTQAQLDHPNLVRVNYADNYRDTYYFVTEFVPGTDLRKLIRRLGPLSYRAAALIIQQAAEGLEHAHRRGLVHRDIKPGNLLVTPEGVTKVIDLGLAWYLEADIHAAKQGDRLKIVGTADYLAPETISNPGCIVPVSDIYALGCTLYYVVTGKVPFPGGNPAEKMQRHMREEPLSPAQLQPDLPQGFVKLIAEMMTKDPEARIPSAAAVAQRLKEWTDEAAIEEIAAAVVQVEAQRTQDNHTPESSGTPINETLTFDDDPFDGSLDGSLKRLNEGSQGTDPIANAAHDTAANTTAAHKMPQFNDEEGASRLGPWVIGSVALAALAILGVLAALLRELLS